MHALLVVFGLRQTPLLEKDHTANLINFYIQLNFWQPPKLKDPKYFTEEGKLDSETMFKLKKDLREKKTRKSNPKLLETNN